MERVLEARGLTLDEYLKISNGILKIPYTQRPYEWGKVQISRLYNDFLNAFENRVEQHILNFITLCKEKEYINIYDGQQRTVSTIIILCALLHKMKSTPKFDEEFLNGVEKDYIVTKNYKTKAIQYKLNFEDREVNEFFINHIISGKAFPDKTIDLSEQQKTLMNNYLTVRKLIDDTFNQIKDSRMLEEFITSITDKVYVIVLETSNEEIANQMFETLNNTGKKIADFYVLKNQMVRVLGEDTVKETWNDIEKNLDGISKNKFLVAYASTFNGKTSESGALKAIEKVKNLTNVDVAKSTLKEIHIAAQSYLYLHIPLLRYDKNKTDMEIFHHLVETLSMVSANQYKMVILAMELKSYPLSEVNSVLKVLLNLHIRNIFISQDPANTLEKFYPKLAKEITETLMPVEKIIDKVKDKMHVGVMLKESFMNRIIKTSAEKRVIRYILREIYNFENQDEVKVFANSQTVNLEHILPQTPSRSSKWCEIFTEEDREKFTDLIGNMTLLLGTKNSTGSNHDFDTKKVIYQESAIKHNQNLSKLKNWDVKAIEKRANDLYEEFIQIW